MKGLERAYQFKLDNGLDIGQNYADLQKQGVPLGKPYQVLDDLLVTEFAKGLGGYDAVRQSVQYLENPQDKARIQNAMARLEACWPHATQTDFLDWLRQNPKATVAQVKQQGYGDKLGEYKTLTAAKKEAGLGLAKKAKK